MDRDDQARMAHFLADLIGDHGLTEASSLPLEGRLSSGHSRFSALMTMEDALRRVLLGRRSDELVDLGRATSSS